MSEINFRQLPRRHWAHPFDHAQPGKSESRGHDASSDAIDGYYGISWLQAFRDHETGEVYAVNCWDGTNRSKGTHSPEDEKWMQQMQDGIVLHTKVKAWEGAKVIELSPQEWALMSGRVFYDWFDLLPGEEFKTVGDEHRFKLEGQVGTINGVRVIVDPHLVNPLGDPSSMIEVQIRADEEEQSGHWNDWGHLDVHSRRGMRNRTGRRVRGPQWAKHLPNQRE